MSEFFLDSVFVFNRYKSDFCPAVLKVFQLIDIRHEPTKLDVDMYRKLCGFGFCPLIIATKADKIKKSQINSHADCIKKVLNVIPDTPIIPFSSVTGLGKEEILEYVEEYAVLFSGDD